MSTASLTDKDVRVRDAVLQQLEWDPAVDATRIGVTAHGAAWAMMRGDHSTISSSWTARKWPACSRLAMRAA